MIDRRIIRALPFSILLLSGCAMQNDGANSAANPPSTNNSAVNGADNRAADAQENRVTTTSPGYEALKQGDNHTAIRDFGAANARTPHNAYDELNLAAAYQNSGQMDKAEPLDRQAMVDGRNARPVETTTALSNGHTVAEIACQNLTMGLPPAAPGTARPCQTTQVSSTTTSFSTETTSSALATQWTRSYAAYFAFGKSDLTREGHDAISAAAKGSHDSPASRVVLVGKTDLAGDDSYNMALSHRRADTVRDALVADGVSASSIDVRWVGEREPPVKTSQGVRNRDNRVVEIGLLK
jgi:outer membrane protein OmpA-like peptidoglycan-associated protein